MTFKEERVYLDWFLNSMLGKKEKKKRNELLIGAQKAKFLTVLGT